MASLNILCSFCVHPDKEFLRKAAIKVHPLPHCDDADTSNRIKTYQSYALEQKLNMKYNRR